MINKYIDKIAYLENDKESDIVVLFLHGWGACKENFIPSINLLQEKYKCIAIDLPGFGESEIIERSYNVDDYVNRVVEFIESKKIKKIILVGHSFGGRIIIKLNNKNDLNFEIVKNIFIDSAGIKPKKTLKQKLNEKTFKFLKKCVKFLPIDENKKNKLIDDMKSKKGSADYRNASPIMRETLVKTVNEDLIDYLRNIKAESLLIWGENDTATPLSDGKIFEKEIKNSGLVILKGCGHFSFAEDSGTYLRVLASYLLS